MVCPQSALLPLVFHYPRGYPILMQPAMAISADNGNVSRRLGRDELDQSQTQIQWDVQRTAMPNSLCLSLCSRNSSLILEVSRVSCVLNESQTKST